MSILSECPICHKKQSAKNKLCKCGENLDKAKRSGRVRYWINLRVDGTQRREYVGKFEDCNGYSIADARAVDAKYSTDKKEGKLFDIKADRKMTFQQLTNWFLDLKKIKSLAYYPILKINLDTFNQVFGNKLVSHIKAADLENYQADRKDAGYSDSYIDQELGAAKRVIFKAFDNDLVSGNSLKAFRMVKKLLKKGSNARDRVLTYLEYKSLLDALPSHLKPIVAASFWTGMRRGEILPLTWNKVDLQARFIRLKAEDTKEGKPKNIPISKTLRSILLQLPGRGTDDFVFKYKGTAISDFRTGLKDGCHKAGILYGRNVENGFTFHDLRRTAKTFARKAGVDKNVRCIIFGHSFGNDMDLRYDIVDEQDLLNAVDQIERFLDSVDQTVDQRYPNAKK